MIRKAARRTMDGIFAVNKPSGVSSNKMIIELQNIFSNSKVFQEDLKEAKQKLRSDLSRDKKWTPNRIDKKVNQLKVKIGHGGTLDPLASGVLVIGVGKGTKKLQYYLSGCNKSYETKALLGISTTTGDSEGEIITKNQISHITKAMIKETGEKFVGALTQTPPIFSALKMNGKPLYDYAREGLPLPKPIKPREVTVASIEVHEQDSLLIDHIFKTLESQLDEDGKPKEHALANNPTLNDSPLYFSKEYLEKAERESLPKCVGKPRPLSDSETLPEVLPMFHMTADVSSGTYIRSLVSDFGRALESSAYMVELIRTKQSEWVLGKNVFDMKDFTERDEKVWGGVLKKVLDYGADLNLSEVFSEVSENPKLQFEPAADDKEIKENSILPEKEEEDVSVPLEELLTRKRNIEEVEK